VDAHKIISCLKSSLILCWIYVKNMENRRVVGVKALLATLFSQQYVRFLNISPPAQRASGSGRPLYPEGKMFKNLTCC